MLNNIRIQTDGTAKNTRIFIDDELCTNLTSMELELGIEDPINCSLNFIPGLACELDFRNYMFLGEDNLEIQTDGNIATSILKFNGKSIYGIVYFKIYIDISSVSLRVETSDTKCFTFEAIKKLFLEQ